MKPLYLGGIAVAGALLFAGHVEAQEFRWNFANAYPPSEYHSRAMTQFAERMREETGGEVDITVHHSGSLFPNTEILQATRDGLVEMGTQLMGNLSRENRLYEVDSIPFLVGGYDDARVLWEEAREPIAELLSESGLELIYMAPWPEQGFWFKKEINSLDDVEGLKMRSYNPMTNRLAEAMGAEPVTVQMTETSQALSTGMIDSLHTAPNSGALYNLDEYTTHYYQTSAWIPYQIFFVRKEAFEQLPEEYQEKAKQIGRDLEDWAWEQSQSVVEEGEKTLAERGMDVQPPGEQLSTELNEVGDQLLSDWLEEASPEAQAVVEAYQKRAGE